jgi:antitoxin component YwqK of YwqJK toxin-antitoxin module
MKILHISVVVLSVIVISVAIGDKLLRYYNSKYVSVRPPELQAKVDAATEIYIDGKDVTRDEDRDTWIYEPAVTGVVLHYSCEDNSSKSLFGNYYACDKDEGQLSAKMTVVDGVVEGTFYYYRRGNGRLIFERNMRNGELDGNTYQYYSDNDTPEGRIFDHSIYKNGQRIFSQGYELDGTKKSFTYFDRLQSWQQGRKYRKLFDTVEDIDERLESGEIGGRQAINEVEEAMDDF